MEQFRYIFRVQCRVDPKRTFTANYKMQVKLKPENKTGPL